MAVFHVCGNVSCHADQASHPPLVITGQDLFRHIEPMPFAVTVAPAQQRLLSHAVNHRTAQGQQPPDIFLIVWVANALPEQIAVLAAFLFAVAQPRGQVAVAEEQLAGLQILHVKRVGYRAQYL